MVRPSCRVRTASSALAATVALCALPALAQESAPRAQGPAQFRHSDVAPGASVGNGSAPTTATGPIGELRGATTPAPGTITGPIGPGDVARLMQVEMPRLRPCYETARATHPQLAGRLDVRFTIGRDGRVTQASASGLPDAPDVAVCVAALLRQTTFPIPQGGSLQFIYPLVFQPPPAVVHGRATRPARAPAPAHRPSAHR
ncbi:MAG: AgmX/PglI C-terminal domain-containing protein [Deltaproteobacteria bacterium]